MASVVILTRLAHTETAAPREAKEATRLAPPRRTTRLAPPRRIAEGLELGACAECGSVCSAGSGAARWPCAGRGEPCAWACSDGGGGGEPCAGGGFCAKRGGTDGGSVKEGVDCAEGGEPCCAGACAERGGVCGCAERDGVRPFAGRGEPCAWACAEGGEACCAGACSEHGGGADRSAARCAERGEPCAWACAECGSCAESSGAGGGGVKPCAGAGAVPPSASPSTSLAAKSAMAAARCPSAAGDGATPPWLCMPVGGL
jgi:hypothetical protein